MTPAGPSLTGTSVVDFVGADGSLGVHRHGEEDSRGGQILPAGYVAGHVELAYATTGHGAQGRTVDTGHAVFSERSSRQGLYVEMTRGREGNWAYVACDTHPVQDEERVVGDPVGTLAQVMTTGDPGLAATQVLRDEHERAESLHTLYPQWKDAAGQHIHTRWAAAVGQTVNPDLAVRIRNSASWPTGGFCRGRTLRHELGHKLGALQSVAPHAYDGAHCNDSGEDTMCYTAATSVDTGGPDFDYNNDDYWDPAANPKLGSQGRLPWWTANLSKFICPTTGCGSPSTPVY